MRAAHVWIPFLALAVGTFGCSSDSSSSGGGGGTAGTGATGGSGGTGGTSGSGATGGSSGSAGSTGTGGSSGAGATDAGSDAPPVVNCDSATEIQEPGTTLCWRLCPIEQAPEGGDCGGTLTSTDWCNASGVNSGACTPSTPGTSLCESVLGAGYRLPTRAEWAELLGNCAPLGVAKVNYACDKCAASTTCNAMFASDTGAYWLADGSNGNAYIVTPKDGFLTLIASNASYAVRCVRDGS